MFISFLIIAHAPYLRRAGRQPIGEDPLHELISQSLIPLLDLLSDFQRSGLKPQIAMACSPLLIEQLADPVVQKHFILWMEERLERRTEELHRFEREHDAHSSYLARFYLEWSRQKLQNFTSRYNRNLVQRLRDLVNAQMVEPLTMPATHAYLPLLGQEESVRAQIEQGLLHTARTIGRPEGIWLPGGAWRAGIEQVMSDVGISYVVVDPSCLPSEAEERPINLPKYRLTAMAHDEGLAQHIWTPELGYVGDPLYRSPDEPGGYAAIGLRSPQPYDPYHALRRAQEHATHFVQLLLAEHERRSPDDLVLILLDTAMIGSTWFEGATWLQAVLMLCATHPGLRITTPAAYLRTKRPRHQANLLVGSWAESGDANWQAPATDAYWRAIHHAEQVMVEIASEFPSAEEDHERVLNQAARELMLAQTSDWPEALVATGVAGEQRERWQINLDRFERLIEIARKTEIDSADLFFLDQVEEIDGPFPNLNYRIFAP